MDSSMVALMSASMGDTHSVGGCEVGHRWARTEFHDGARYKKKYSVKLYTYTMHRTRADRDRGPGHVEPRVR